MMNDVIGRSDVRGVPFGDCPAERRLANRTENAAGEFVKRFHGSPLRKLLFPKPRETREHTGKANGGA